MPIQQIPALAGPSIETYVSPPPTASGPGLIVIHEIFGLSPDIQKVCDAYAAQGYYVFCPNLFARQGVAASDEADWDKAAKLYKSFNVEAGIQDLLSVLAYIRKQASCLGKVGVVGYCLGSRLAFLLSSRSEIDAAVGYYAVGIDGYLDEVYDVRQPLLLHLGEQDKLVPPSTQKHLLKSFERNALISAFVYPLAEHGFMREESPSYHEPSSLQAKKRTDEFLNTHLKV